MNKSENESAAAGPEELPGAANLVPKRQNIAANMVSQATALWTAAQALSELQLEYLQAGSFQDSDFTATSMPHLTAYLAGLMLSTVVPALSTWFTTALPSSGPVPRDIFLQVRS